MTQSITNSRAAIQELLGGGPVAYYRAFAAIGGGVTAGVFLSQLYYWHDKGADPDGWVFKTQAEWQEETGLTRREQETARRNLRQRGILEEKLAGIPARLHYRLDVDRVVALLADRHRARRAASSGDPLRHQPDRGAGLSASERRSSQPAPAPRGAASGRRDAPWERETEGSLRRDAEIEAGASESAEQARREAPHQSARTCQTSAAESAHQAGRNRSHKSAPTRQPRLAESAKQARRKPPDKPARIRQTSLAESARHTKTTIDYDTDVSRDYGTQYRRERSREAAAASPMRAICSVHGVTMHLRQKDGDTWYSHRLPDGTWCRGAPGDQPSREPDPQGWERRRAYALQFAGMGLALPGLTPEEVVAAPARSPSPRGASP